MDRATAASFDRLLDQAMEHGPDHPIDYELDVPKWQFLCHVAERTGMVLHGSGDPDITQFEPRQPADTLEFSNQHAVFAATDGIWPMYYAIVDRERHPTMMLCNSSVRISSGGQLSDAHYFFSISEWALKQQPWRSGTVYLLPADTFENQPAIEADGLLIQIAQAASPLPVAPVAKLPVQPSDFPFLNQIHGHDDDLLNARIAANPEGFPWFEDH